ncbi:MFS general substrate transporter [Dentipellis sp. KUC8613]|nr:MFS general substrate transporter [Dentipellis sp. KUC8613]
MSSADVSGESSPRPSALGPYEDGPHESHPLLGNDANQEYPPRHLAVYQPPSLRFRAFLVRVLALLCACFFSVGSHYGSYILAPLKSRLSREMGTSNTEFSLLVSAFSLNSTWTPLIGGLMASRLGTTFTSILATGAIFSGLSLLLIGDLMQSVRLMACGMFIFGLGVSPLAVVQETIIVRFFRSHGLGLSLALGLVAGKAASFISARTSYPLSERYGPHAPFYAAATLGAISFLINLVYVYASAWLVDGAGAELEAPELQEAARRFAIQDMSEAEALEKVAKKKKVNLRELTKLGDVFWAYIAVNVLCGAIWHPFTHLAANIIERRYQLPESEASTQASYLLAGSIFLYPIVGFIIDRVKRPSFVIVLFACSSLLTLFAYTWLVLPPSATHTAWPAIVSFATGIGYSPLLLVVIVPQLVQSKYISTTLGAHKSLEQTGTTISQTLAGIALDAKVKNIMDISSKNHAAEDARYQSLLFSFLVVNVLQFIGIILLAYLDRRDKAANRHWLANTNPEPAPSQTLEHPDLQGPEIAAESEEDLALEPERRRRGKFFAVSCVVLIVFAWVLFLVTAWMKLRSKREREGGRAPT